MSAFNGKGKIKDQLPESGPTPESLGFVHVSEPVAALDVECPACMGSGGGEFDGGQYECDPCYGTGRMTLKEAEAWIEQNRPWM